MFVSTPLQNYLLRRHVFLGNIKVQGIGLLKQQYQNFFHSQDAKRSTI
jgi:hypothetical protein